MNASSANLPLIGNRLL